MCNLLENFPSKLLSGLRLHIIFNFLGKFLRMENFTFKERKYFSNIYKSWYNMRFWVQRAFTLQFISISKVSCLNIEMWKNAIRELACLLVMQLENRTEGILGKSFFKTCNYRVYSCKALLLTWRVSWVSLWMDLCDAVMIPGKSSDRQTRRATLKPLKPQNQL